MHKEVLKGKFVLQLDEVINMAAAARERYTDQSGNRCLKFALTDGCQQVVGVEHAHLPAFAWDCPAGTKVIIHNVPIRRGLLLLGPDNTALLGGQVERLEAARQRAVAAWTKPVVGRPAGSAARDIFAEARQAAWAPGAPTGAAAQQPTGGPQAGVETAGAAAGAQGGNPQQQAPPPAAAAALFMVPAGGPPAGAGAGGGGGTAGAALPAQPQHPMHLQQQQQQTASNAVVRGPVPGAGGPGMATAAAAGPALQHPQGNPQTPHNFQPPPPPPPQQQQQGWQQQQQQQQDRQEQWPTQPRGSTPWTQAVAIPTAAAAPPPPATAWLGRSTDATHPHAHANRPAASFGVLTTAAAAAGSSRTAGGGGAAAVRAVREDGGGYDVRTAAAAAVAVRGEQGDSSAYAMEVMTISDSGSGESPPRASINQQLQGPGDGINPHAVSVPPPQNQHQHPFANDPPPPLPPPQQQQPTAAAAAAAGGGSSAGVYGAGAGAVGSVASRKPALPLARSSPGPTVSSLGSAGRSGGGGGVGGSIAAAHSPTKSVSVLGCGAVHRRAEAAASGAAAAVAQPHRVQCAPGAAAPGAVNGSRLGGAIHPGAPGVGAWSWQCGAVAAATGHGSSGGGEEQAAADDCDGMVEGHHSRDLPPQPLAAAAAAPDGSFFKGPEQDGYTHAQAQPPPQPANHAGAVLLCQVPDILQPEPDSDTPVTFPVTLDVYGLFHALEGTHAIIEDGTAIVEAEFADGALATILAGVTAPGGFSPGAPIGLEELQAMADSPDPAVQAHGQELALRVMEFIRDFSGMIRLEYRSPLPTQPPLIIQLTNDGDGGNGGDRPGGPNTSRDVVTAADDATAGQRGRQADGDSCQLYEEFLQGVGVLDASGDGDM
ncbi:hypothetical protein VOLCADRAFT_104113 [Volvox carteri f. nagariensis]|uniref:RecQ-mediated genome instability protein 1 n=1 Tax=Volvox carteri f. nagariensis TaxID=3068 RepID=D8TRB5_VOLCA|nr:uncharacterized protein VOLCADRAFT_104113 [Volvox carteri f. nagariensis]EFJ49862.1 hypothetical protein VOLCADRAFT_104113 [Volvox carteri f. nagariensis]|eukprot:XP_002948927.1 hypothetical protein VOLCADRAFT_104113 [Volvox carteri f. nagariensis]